MCLNLGPTQSSDVPRRGAGGKQAVAGRGVVGRRAVPGGCGGEKLMGGWPGLTLLVSSLVTIRAVADAAQQPVSSLPRPFGPSQGALSSVMKHRP